MKLAVVLDCRGRHEEMAERLARFALRTGCMAVVHLRPRWRSFLTPSRWTAFILGQYEVVECVNAEEIPRFVQAAAAVSSWHKPYIYFTVDKTSGQDGDVCYVEPLDEEAYVYAAEDVIDNIVAALADGVDG